MRLQESQPKSLAIEVVSSQSKVSVSVDGTTVSHRNDTEFSLIIVVWSIHILWVNLMKASVSHFSCSTCIWKDKNFFESYKCLKIRTVSQNIFVMVFTCKYYLIKIWSCLCTESGYDNGQVQKCFIYVIQVLLHVLVFYAEPFFF